jgi:hypothetical protein
MTEEKYLNFIKKVNLIKWENIIIFLTIPLQILQFIQAESDFKLMAILVDIVLFEGIALAIRTGRKQTLQELKEDTFEGLFEPEEIVEMYEKITQPIRTIRAILKAQKKKKFQKTIFYLPEQKNECFSKRL